MGKHARIAELEREVAYWKARASVQDEVRDFLITLAEMPEDTVLLYTISDQRISHEIGKSARVILGRL